MSTLTAPEPRPGECPVGCGRPVRPGHLMCRKCWGEVPIHLQNEVNRSWRKYNRLRHEETRPFGEDRLAEFQARLQAAREAYQAARDAAIGSVP
jgi:hypothetical protein